MTAERMEEGTASKIPEIAARILDAHGERTVLLGETPDDVLDVGGRDSAADDTPTFTPSRRPSAGRASERHMRVNPPKRVG